MRCTSLLALTGILTGMLIGCAVAPPTTLPNTGWILRSFTNSEGTEVNVLEGTQISIRFESGGRFAGNAGCNNYSASYEIDNTSIAIGPAAATRRFCGDPANIMEQESGFLALLQAAATFDARPNSLEILDGNRTTIMMLARDE